MSAGQRPRTYDDATIKRWADAILAGISGHDFRARFGLTLEAARRAAARRDAPMPACAEARFGGALQNIKAPPGRWKT